jgi:hypothetical protein
MEGLSRPTTIKYPDTWDERWASELDGRPIPLTMQHLKPRRAEQLQEDGKVPLLPAVPELPRQDIFLPPRIFPLDGRIRPSAEPRFSS